MENIYEDFKFKVYHDSVIQDYVTEEGIVFYSGEHIIRCILLKKRKCIFDLLFIGNCSKLERMTQFVLCFKQILDLDAQRWLFSTLMETFKKVRLWDNYPIPISDVFH